MDEVRLTPAREASMGQPGIDRARRVSPDFASYFMEAAESLTPDADFENQRLVLENLTQQTIAMNLLASRTSPAFNPAVVGYAAQLANQVNLEGGVQPHNPRPQFGDRFMERDRTDGHMRVPPVNEAKGGPTVL